MALAKAKTFALSIAGSTSGTMIAIYARDRRVRVFDVARGALLLTVDDSTQQYIDYQESKGTRADMLYLEKLDF